MSFIETYSIKKKENNNIDIKSSTSADNQLVIDDISNPINHQKYQSSDRCNFIKKHRSSIFNILVVSFNIIIISVLISSTKSQVDEVKGAIGVFKSVISDYIINAPKIQLAYNLISDITLKLNDSKSSMDVIDSTVATLRLLNLTALENIGDISMNMTQLIKIVDVLTRGGSIDYNGYVESQVNGFTPILLYTNMLTDGMVGTWSTRMLYWHVCSKISNNVNISCQFNYTENYGYDSNTIIYQSKGFIYKSKNNDPLLTINITEFFECTQKVRAAVGPNAAINVGRGNNYNRLSFDELKSISEYNLQIYNNAYSYLLLPKSIYNFDLNDDGKIICVV